MKNPVVYWELASHDAKKTTDFLKKVFQWAPEYDKQTGIYELRAGDSRKFFVGGGAFTLKRPRLPFLTIYIQVADIVTKAKLVEKHGGFIVTPPNEIFPGTIICLFNEPSGVTLAMVQRKKR